MKTTIHEIRKTIIIALQDITQNGASVPIYNKVPDNVSYPFMKVYSEKESPIEKNNSAAITNSIIKIDVVTRFTGDAGGELDCNQIVSNVIDTLTGASSFTTTADFNNYVFEIDEVVYFEENLKDHHYFRGIISISFQTEQL